MRFSGKLLAVGMLLVLLGLHLGSGVAVRAAASAEALSVATANTVEVHASGFQPGEKVAVWMTGPSAQVVAVDTYYDTTDQGTTTFPVEFSPAAEAGHWWITVHGLDSQQEAHAQADKLAGSADDGEDADDEEDNDEDGAGEDDGDEDSDGDTDGDDADSD